MIFLTPENVDVYKFWIAIQFKDLSDIFWLKQSVHSHCQNSHQVLRHSDGAFGPNLHEECIQIIYQGGVLPRSDLYFCYFATQHPSKSTISTVDVQLSSGTELFCSRNAPFSNGSPMKTCRRGTSSSQWMASVKMLRRKELQQIEFGKSKQIFREYPLVIKHGNGKFSINGGF